MKNNYPTPTAAVIDTERARCLCASEEPTTLTDYEETTIIDENF